MKNTQYFLVQVQAFYSREEDVEEYRLPFQLQDAQGKLIEANLLAVGNSNDGSYSGLPEYELQNEGVLEFVQQADAEAELKLLILKHMEAGLGDGTHFLTLWEHSWEEVGANHTGPGYTENDFTLLGEVNLDKLPLTLLSSQSVSLKS